MRWSLIWMSMLSIVQCRPQGSTESGSTESSVEVEKQVLVELKPLPSRYLDHKDQPSHRKIEDNTQEILEKIAEVNKKQGLTPKRTKPSYFHFPFSYSRSQNTDNEGRIDFKFPTNPFTNPIFEYLEREKQIKNTEENEEILPQLRHEVHSSEDSPVYGTSSTDTNPDITADDIVPGQYIKRKITHHQAFILPNPNSVLPNGNSMMQPVIPTNFAPMNFPTMQQVVPNLQAIPQLPPQESHMKIDDKKVLNNLEKQTIENVKNIVSNSQPLPYYYNPYAQYYQGSYPYSYGYLPYDYNKNYAPTGQDKARQNWNWPGANLFPIYIRDPFLQMYYAVTNMVEYGPNAGSGGPCKLTPRPQKNNPNRMVEIRESKTTWPDVTTSKVVFEMTDDKEPQITIYGVDGDETKNSTSYLDIESVDLGYSKENEVKFSVNIRNERKNDSKQLKTESTWDKLHDSARLQITKDGSSVANKVDRGTFRPIILPSPTKPITRPELKQVLELPSSPPIRDQILHDDELAEDEPVEAEKAEDVSIQNNGSKKVLSRDNTGSGIFIHKLKVRKGGVAIAGPGGIATAGSGGTAIVGPQGVAYTHPDSLAIAGSGTKVIAVDPAINLSDIIKNSTLANGTRTEVSPQRVGKLVAVGPVVYYNKG